MAVAKTQGRRAPGNATFAAALMGVLLGPLLFSYAWSASRGSRSESGSGTAQSIAGGGSGNKDAALQVLLETRVCGSPAVDGYAHVDPTCLENSPTNKWWQQHKPPPDDLDVHIERAADYDGMAVGWGIGNTKASIEECAEACRQHVPKGPSIGLFGSLPCNTFAFCAFETCFEPDAHKHSKGDCWLKFTEAPASPEVNMRGRLPLAMQQRHPKAPKEVQWHAGVLLPHGVTLTNGSWSPRHQW